MAENEIDEDKFVVESPASSKTDIRVLDHTLAYVKEKLSLVHQYDNIYGRNN